jgi:hypothetical protein
MIIQNGLILDFLTMKTMGHLEPCKKFADTLASRVNKYIIFPTIF